MATSPDTKVQPSRQAKVNARRRLKSQINTGGHDPTISDEYEVESVDPPALTKETNISDVDLLALKSSTPVAELTRIFDKQDLGTTSNGGNDSLQGSLDQGILATPKGYREKTDVESEGESGSELDTPKRHRGQNPEYNKEQVKNILNEPEVAELREACLADYEKFEETKDPVLKAQKAILYINMMQSKCTRLPKGFTHDINRALGVVQEVLTMMDRRLTVANAMVRGRIAAPDITGKELNNHTAPYQPLSPASHTRKTFAQALNKASKTLIVKDPKNPERTADQIRNQVTTALQGHKDLIEKVDNIKGGVVLACDSADSVEQIRGILENQTEGVQEIIVKQAEVRKTKVIIFNIPNTFQNEEVISKINKTLKMEHNEMTVTKELPGLNDDKHLILTLPTVIATNLLNGKRVNLGLKECVVKKHINIVRCNRCQAYDHVRAECPSNTEYCGRCEGNHARENCTSKEVISCQNCRVFNVNAGSKGLEKVDSRHESNSPNCHVYRQLLMARQYVNEKRVNRKVSGSDIITGKLHVLKNKDGKTEFYVNEGFTGGQNRRNLPRQQGTNNNYNNNGPSRHYNTAYRQNNGGQFQQNQYNQNYRGGGQQGGYRGGNNNVNANGGWKQVSYGRGGRRNGNLYAHNQNSR